MRPTRRSLARVAGVVAALASMAAMAPAQTTRRAVIQRPAQTPTRLARTKSETAAIDAFRHGTRADARGTIPYQYLQSVQLHWSPYPGAAGYRIVRSWSATGPWVAAAPTASSARITLQKVQGLLPGRTLYFRVVALGVQNKTMVALDSSNASVVRIAGFSAIAPTTSKPGFVHLVPCPAAPSAQVTLIWHVVPGASGYRVVQGIDTRPVGLAPSPRAVPGEAEAQQVATFVVRDTVFSQSSVATGRYVYAVEPLFKMLNDSVEEPAKFFGAGVRFDLSMTAHACS